MSYKGVVQDLLDAADADVGDEVEVEPAEGRSHRGVVMPHHSNSDPEVLTLKLDNGYNVGLALTEDATLERLGAPEQAETGTRETPEDPGLPTVAILGTGGTIASYVDYRTGAVHPATSPEELAFADPDLFDVANVEAEVLFQAFSEDLTPGHWVEIAEAAADALEAGARGVVVPHGTDTMGYTGAALSFLLSDLPGPVVLVGAQRSSDRPSTDAELNLRSAVRVAAEADLGEVVAVMHAETGDTDCHVHRATRVRKMHTSRRDAFQSVNAAPIGTADADGVTLSKRAEPAKEGPPEVDDRLEPDVAFVHSVPGLGPHRIPGPDEAQGIVLAGTGLGHVPHDAFPALEEHLEAGQPVVMASQCLHGRTNLNVYSTGRDLLDLGVVPAGDTLPETAYVKLMVALGRGMDRDEVAAFFEDDLAGERSDRTPASAYPRPRGGDA